MKPKKYLSLICALIMVIGCAVPAVAAQPTPANNKKISTSKTGSLIKELIKIDLNAFQYYSQFPNPIAQLAQEAKDGTISLNNAEAEGIVAHISVISVDVSNTFNPKNNEFGKIGRYPVPGTANSSQPQLKNIDMVRLHYPGEYLNPQGNQGEVLIAPLYFLIDGNGNLHVICNVTNITGNTISFKGVDQIEILANGKVLASGNPKLSEEALTFSSLPLERKYNSSNKIIDGYPTGGFVDIIFEPGTYDASQPIADVDDISFSCALNYSSVK